MAAMLTPAPAPPKHPAGETCRPRCVDADHPHGGFVPARRGATVVSVVSATITAHRLFATRPASGWLLDAVIAAVALAGSLLLISHGGVAARSGGRRRGLDGARWSLLAVCASVPLVAWRRSPLGVFAVTAAASALLAGLGYPSTAARRERRPLPAGREPRTRRPVDGPHHRHRGRALRRLPGGRRRPGRAGFPGSELLHSGLAWAVGVVRRRAHPAAARAHRRAQRARRARRARRPSASAGSPSPRSAPGSPATSTTPPATPST